MDVIKLFKSAIKRLIVTITSITLVATCAISIHADDLIENEPFEEVFSTQAITQLTPPKIAASAAIVIDMKSGRVLYEKNAHSRKSIASTTKIMTAIVAIEKGNLTDKILISKKASNIRGSTINLNEGEELTLRELLYGLMLKSGNDAAIAIAEHIGGSVEGFAVLMNEKAQQLGLKNTQFKTPHGLDTPGHYSTAYELAQIARYALNNPVFSEIVATQNASITGRSLYTTNEMLSSYPGADGVKTGYTGQAGRCLVTSATRNNMRLISVVLNCASRTIRAQNSQAILDYSFNNYNLHTIFDNSKNTYSLQVIKGISATVPVVATETIEVPLNKDELNNLKMDVCLYQDKLVAPVRKNSDVGHITFTINGTTLATTLLKTNADVARKNFSNYFHDTFQIWYRLMKADFHQH